MQFGDYREAYERLARGGLETYHEQRWTVDFVGGLAKAAGNTVTVVCVNAPPYEARLANGVVAIGLPLWHGASQRDLTAVVARTSPTHVVLHSPIFGIVVWAMMRRLRLLPLLADGFGCDSRFRVRIRESTVAWLFNRLPCVANNQVNAACSLAQAGVDAERVIPWDWPKRSPGTELPWKHAPPAGGVLRLVHVSALIRSKGVGDVVRAAGIVRARGVTATLTVIGDGPDRQSLEAETAALGLGSAVQFVGRIALDQVVPQMRAHDIVVMASRPEYPEAWPNTVLHTWRSRTPLVASDHPMFRGLVRDGETGLTFRAGNADDLAEAIQRLRQDPALYERLSLASGAAPSSLPRAARWDELITRFLADGREDRQWMRDTSLGSGRYHDWVARYWPSLSSKRAHK